MIYFNARKVDVVSFVCKIPVMNIYDTFDVNDALHYILLEMGNITVMCISWKEWIVFCHNTQLVIHKVFN